MLLAGTNIQDAGDLMQKVTVEYVYHALRNPRSDIAARVRQLRIVRQLDGKQYAVLKKQLPYFVCGMFQPHYRKTENFAYISYFVVDIDHLSEKQLSVASVRSLLSRDARSLLVFASPGEDGVKVLFKLKERCYDAGLFKLFYKMFAHKLSEQYGLDQVIDVRTCDTARACFMSIDSDAYYNPHCEEVDMSEFIPLDNMQALFDVKRDMAAKKAELLPKHKGKEGESFNDPNVDEMTHIKQVLQMKLSSHPKHKKEEIVIPQRLNEILDELKKYVDECGIELYEIINIQYAKKLRFRLGHRLAEINLFYGKKGFKVVQSPRCGTSAELNNLSAEIIDTFLYEHT